MSPMYGQDMSKVAKWGDLLPEGWYRVRVEKGEQRDSKESGQPTWALWMKVQNEPFVGQVIFDQPSLQPQALAKLKAYYVAAGYEPGPEGHDPERLNGSEFFVKLAREIYQGEPRNKIAPNAIRSINEGPTGPMAQAATAGA